MVKKTIYAMRHCETLFNVQGKTQGWCDSPITDRGRAQCRIAGEELARRGMTFDHYYSSTSERCCDTMEIVCQTAFGEVKPYVRMKDLREFGFGAYEGKDDYLEPPFDLPEVRSQVISAKGGETDEQVCERMNRAMNAIVADPDVERALVVSSGGALMHFYFSHRETATAKPVGHANCMTFVYEWEDGVFRCVEMFIPDLSSLEKPGMPPQIRPAIPEPEEE